MSMSPNYHDDFARYVLRHAVAQLGGAWVFADPAQPSAWEVDAVHRRLTRMLAESSDCWPWRDMLGRACVPGQELLASQIRHLLAP